MGVVGVVVFDVVVVVVVVAVVVVVVVANVLIIAEIGDAGRGVAFEVRCKKSG